MFDQEPPDAPKVPSTAGVQQRDPDQLKDELERVLRAYIDRRAGRLPMQSGGQPF